MPNLPAALPPAERTVGQVVAETIRFYGANFWRVLPLGLPLAIAREIVLGHRINTQIPLLCLLAPLFSAGFVYASMLVLDAHPSRKRTLFAFAVGMLVWIPAPVLLLAYDIPALAWLALFGLAVPVALNEALGFRDTLVRARRLATADYVHELGSLCALLIVVVLSAGTMAALLHGSAEAARRVAAFLALLVLSPMLFVGPALLYFDQAARVGSSRAGRRKIRQRAGSDSR
jgi:hypothetical protein